MQPIIKVRALSKRYRLGKRERYGNLRESITGAMRATLRKLHSRNGEHATAHEPEIWALRNVDLDVQPGEVLGIIGGNGAGKSTLLKVLSRIAYPTSGRVELNGRVASLLEVGTGFHPELTGRENIFLNGAILGMRRGEIAARFDEIVDFSGVEEFLDTPVKRYSSGMHTRLAFAVAAHLQPEILLVDEVLAVGDWQFQKKCLRKMQEVSRGGRTVLFVSHNMEAVLRLCTRGILMVSGEIAEYGPVSKVAARYLEEHIASPSRVVDLTQQSRPNDTVGRARLVSLSPAGSKRGWAFPFGQDLAFEIQIETRQLFDNIELGVTLGSARGFKVASWTSTYAGIKLPLEPGLNIIEVTYEHFVILPGQYYLDISLRSDRGMEDYVYEEIRLEVLINKASAEANADSFSGVFIPTVKAASKLAISPCVQNNSAVRNLD